MQDKIRLSPIEMLDRLVSFPTESARSNLPLIDFVEDVPARLRPLSRAGAERGRRQGGALCDDRAAGSRRRRALGPHRRRAGNGTGLDLDPFRLRVADGRLFGRGAVDMKGFCALALALVPEFLAADLKTPDPSRALLRRGDDLPRGRRHDPPLRPRPADAAHRHRRRADGACRRRRAQERRHLPHLRARLRSAFGQARPRRERGDGGGASSSRNSAASPT